MKKKIFTALGLMSGTSMDGVDLSLIKSDGDSQFTHILDNYFEFDLDLRKRLIELRNKLLTQGDLKKYSEEINEVEKKFTLFNSKIINKVLNDFDDNIDLIGFHGQTIFHNSNEKISKQIGDGHLLSQLTKKIIINNFRQQDLMNEGEGAPLTPIFHKLLSNFFNKEYKLNFPMNIINIGGITNITQILADKNKIYAYDIAPGNCLIDEWIRKNSKKKFDNNGNFAKSGKVDDLILNQAIDNFSIKSYKKSLDVTDFDISFAKGLSLEDGSATLTKFSSHLIAQGIERVNKLNNSFANTNIICGGGRKNTFLIKSIKKNFIRDIELTDIDQYKINGDFVESQAFGYLSIRTFLNLPISFPNTTRCKTPTVGGTIIKNF
jgi:anhydro-N-acetylmuramic acid kinase|tara:strand:+ start:89 stop:1222 length:1134 start_codon:yes stop_codon:yes gene_type:complete